MSSRNQDQFQTNKSTYGNNNGLFDNESTLSKIMNGTQRFEPNKLKLYEGNANDQKSNQLRTTNDNSPKHLNSTAKIANGDKDFSFKDD